MREKNGFSLMEMMVVLLIMSIIAAATAPIVSKKMMQSSKSNASPWVFTGQGKNIAYNMGGLDNATAIIGAAKVPAGTKTRLYIDCGNNASQIALGSGDTAANILADPVGKRVGIFSAGSNVNVPNNSIAIGMDQALGGSGIVAVGTGAQTSSDKATAVGYSAKTSQASAVSVGDSSNASGKQSIAIGANSDANGVNSIALGANAYTSTTGAVAIGGSDGSQYRAEAGHYGTAVGYYARATGGSCMTAIGNNAMASANYAVAAGWKANASMDSSVAIGNSPKAAGSLSIAIGNNARASAFNSIAIGSGSNSDYPQATQRGSVAIGYNAKATHAQSYAIGNGAKTTASNQIVLGNKDYTVYIPGRLVVGKSVYVGADSDDGAPDTGSPLFVRFNLNTGSVVGRIHEQRGSSASIHYEGNYINNIYRSDKRLKNIGEKYTAGINELKKLDFFHYTFKKDESKTPHVGVIAQDLQKVFPDAVTKGEDGYLRIRFEDMFYAVINAVKELDNKISEIASQVKSSAEEIKNLKIKNDEQDKIIEELQKTVNELKLQNEEQKKIIEKLEKQI